MDCAGDLDRRRARFPTAPGLCASASASMIKEIVQNSPHRWLMLKPSIETHNVDGILVAEFWDSLRLDPAPVQDLRNHYEAHLKTQGRPDLVIDLSGVGFAGSAALGNFVALQRLVRSKGGRIVFCEVDPTVSEVFRASKLESLFEFVADRPAALL